MSICSIIKVKCLPPQVFTMLCFAIFFSKIIRSSYMHTFPSSWFISSWPKSSQMPFWFISLFNSSFIFLIFLSFSFKREMRKMRVRQVHYSLLISCINIASPTFKHSNNLLIYFLLPNSIFSIFMLPLSGLW